MQRSGGLSLSHVFPLRMPTSNIQIRFKSHQRHRRRRLWPNTKDLPLRNNYISFEASNLLLDLDAEDSSYVRPYDEDIDGVPALARRHSSIVLHQFKRRVAAFERLSKKLDDNFNYTATTKFNCWHISDYDILSVALDDICIDIAELPSADAKSHPNKSMIDIFRWNGIPRPAKTSFPLTVAYMLRRQQLIQRQPTGVNDKRLFKKALEKCEDFFTLERLIAKATRTPQGYELISFCVLTLLVRVCLIMTNTAPPEMLSFLNNLILNFKSRKLRAPLLLIWLAYVTALRCRAFTTAQKYLKIIRDGGGSLYNSQGIFETLQVLEKSIAPIIPNNVESYFEWDTIPQLLAIYGLLIGRVLGEEMRQASLHDVIFKCELETYQLYVSCLARLGCFRTLWYIWHTHRKDAMEIPVESFTPNQEDDFSMTNFINTTKMSMGGGVASDVETLPKDLNKQLSEKEAFSIALQSAFKTNSRLAELAQAPRFAHTANQFNGDCQLDMENIVQSADVISTRDYGHFYPFKPGDVDMIFGKPSIQEAMSALQSYLSWNAPRHVTRDEASSPVQNQGSGL
ncbi:hypothetical protein F4776DRAFT_608496 [Hypoxylon sp. NC0597]|nr:hypothetical protein F4776DRAFT_608496 [Hypoxylon sp. NC0597]